MPKIYGSTEILGGDLTVLGNMVISGTQTSLNVEELIVSDNIITLNGTFSGAPVLDSGIEINRGSSTNSRLIWNETTDYWVAGLSGSETPLLTGSGTTNYIPKWDNNTLSSTSSIYDDGTNVGIGTSTPTEILQISESDGNRITKLKVENGGSTLDVDGAGINLTSANVSWDIQLLKNNSDTSFAGALQFKYGNTLKNHFDSDGSLFFDGSNQYIQLPINGWIALDGAGGGTAGLWYNTSDEIELYANGTASELKIATSVIESYAFVNISSASTQFFPITTGFRETIPTAGASGRLVYNSTTSAFNYWNGATWSNMGGDNFADTDLTFTGSRIHSTNNNYLEVKTAATTFERGWMIVGDVDTGTRAYSGIGYATSYVYTDVNDKTYIAANDINRLVVASSSIVINETSENDFDFRVEGATDPNLLFVHGSSSNIGVGNNTPLYKLQVSGTVSTTGFRMTDGASSGYVLTSDTNGVASWTESSGGISGTGTTNYISKWSSATGLTDSLASSGDTGVGIGTASADNMLTVFGDANVTGDFLIHSDSITTSAGVKGSVTWFDYDGPTVHILSNADTSGTSSVARFMIGDFTTPANKNYGQFAYFPPTYLKNGGSTAYQNMLVMKANSGLAGMILDLDDGGGGTVSILPGRADVVFPESNGFVGVGEVVPVEKLDVLGNVKITGQVYIDIPSTLSPSTNSQNIDWDNGNIQVIDFQNAPVGITFSFSNVKTGGTYTLEIIQGANLTNITWPTSIKWESGVSLIPTNVDNAVDVVTMVYNGTNYYASFGKNFS